ncbi:TIGR04283 family arsenosugar biosynthesis glycosyltransferase [Psychromarinibacter sp. C21-152]|uniref:TIGR04283 family arsenosugar biosynthesis glycosyltransferase n=1 Tax=Psychromarinibacter sediminicola TaxID=3033385 RepID=A0AAE3NPA0_9RHOB|nr:TIGR04283 family arsenosugar biosynthesis glycosyltransferase [Psychromarinibacter sediminicola]MDF0599931.1 TIGR04283 family arsenosugar biosynthesis glycosyltransferase [Psychromarinibacter sediminicola]
MRAPVSVIVPTLDAAREVPATLASLGEGLEEGVIRELILSDGGSADGTARIADAAGAILVTGPAGRGGQLARGAAEAQAEWLLFLHADTQLGPGWAPALLGHLRDHPDKAGHFRLAFRADGSAARLVARWANFRARAFGLPYGDQGLLISRRLYDAVGGYPEIPLMEDVALARALGRRLVPLPATAWTSAERYERQGWLRRGTRNLVTLTRYLLGADPERLARAYSR